MIGSGGRPRRAFAGFEQLPAVWRPFYNLLVETGLRIGEAIELRWSDVDFGSKRLRVERQFYRGRVRKPKGRKTCSISLTRETAQQLWARQGSPDELIFTSAQGKRLEQSNLMSRTQARSGTGRAGGVVKGTRGERLPAALIPGKNRRRSRRLKSVGP